MANQTRQDEKEPKSRRWSGLAVAVMKMAAAGLVVWGVGFGITVVDVGGPIAESHADIFSAWGGPSNEQRFDDALESLGHDEPRVYELNGNLINFSVDYRRERPVEVAREYQREFAERGLSDETYDSFDLEAIAASKETRLTGGIGPIRMDNNRIILGGMLTQNRAESREELLEEVTEVDDWTPEEIFDAHRWIEVFREPGDSRTTVLATWSDGDFSYDKMLGGNDRKADTYRGAESEIPACPGCTRVNQFADRDDPRGYRTNLYIASATEQEMIEFYEQAMRSRGWEEAEVQEAQRRLDDHVNYGDQQMEQINFERDEQRVDIFVYPHDDRDVAVQTVFWDDLEG